MLRLIMILLIFYVQTINAGTINAGTISYGKELSPDSTCTQSDKWDGLRNASTDLTGTTITLENNAFSYAYQSDFPNLEAGKTYLVSVEFQNYQGSGQFALSPAGNEPNPKLVFDVGNGIQEHLYTPSDTVSEYGIKRQYGAGNLSATLKRFSVKEVLHNDDLPQVDHSKIKIGNEMSPDTTATSAKWDNLLNATKNADGTSINVEDNEYSFAFQRNFPTLVAGRTYLIHVEFRDYLGNGQFEFSPHGNNSEPRLVFAAGNGPQEYLYTPAINESSYGIKRLYGAGDWSATLKNFSVKEVTSFNPNPNPEPGELSPDPTATDSTKWDELRNATVDFYGTNLNVVNGAWTYASQSSFPVLEAGKEYEIKVKFENYIGDGQFSLAHLGSDANPKINFEAKNGVQTLKYTPLKDFSGYGIKRRPGSGDWSATLVLFSVKESIGNQGPVPIPLGPELSPNASCNDNTLWDNALNADVSSNGVTIDVVDADYSYIYQDSFPKLEKGKTYLIDVAFQDYVGLGQFSLSSAGGDSDPKVHFEARNGTQQIAFTPKSTKSDYGIKRRNEVGGNWSARLVRFSVKEMSEHSVLLYNLNIEAEKQKLIKKSDVSFSPRWLTKYDVDSKAKEFHTTRLDWVYSNDSVSIEELKNSVGFFGGALNSKLPDTLGGNTRNHGRMEDKNGNKITAPWMHTMHEPWWGDVNDPEFQKVFIEHAKALVDGNVDHIHVDDAGMNFATLRWEPDMCHNYYCESKAKEKGLDIYNKDDMRILQRESVKEFYETVRKEIDAYAKRHIKFSLNQPNRNFPYDLFDYSIDELSETHGNAKYIYESISTRTKPQIFTYTGDNVTKTRKVLASSYASGGHMIVPHDVYNPKGGRIYGYPKDSADLYAFIRANANYLDGFAAYDVTGSNLSAYQKTNSAFALTSSNNVDAYWRKNAKGTNVIHLVDWSGANNQYKLKIKTSELTGSASNAKLFIPVVYIQSEHEKAASSKDYSTMRKSVSVNSNIEGAYTVFTIPKVETWGLFVF